MTVTRIDLGQEYLGGLAKPTVDDVGKLAVVALDSLGRPNFQYLTQTATVADNTFATTLAPFLRGTGLTVDTDGNLKTRHRPRRPQEYDYFRTGSNATGAIGKLGWNLLGNGTPTYSRQSVTTLATSLAGLLGTSASINDRSVLAWGETESRTCVSLSEISILQCSLSLNNVLTDKRVFFGLMSDLSAEPSAMAEGIGFYYDSAVSANWRIISRASSTGSPTDGGGSFVVPANSSQLFTMYQPTANTWQFYIGNTQVGGNITTNLPTGGLNVGFRVQTLAASAKNLRIGYFGLNANAAGALDDDAFLEA